MTKLTCVDFAEAITTVQDITVNDYRVTTLFDKYSRKLGNGKLITLEEFLQFYQDQASSKPDVVRQNLGHQGILTDFTPKVD
jgi:hypothetical protein